MLDRYVAPGDVTAAQVRIGDPYEVSNGHRIELGPAGGRGGRANLVGASVLDTDPAVQSAAIDTGFSPNKKTLRAPDIADRRYPGCTGMGSRHAAVGRRVCRHGPSTRTERLLSAPTLAAVLAEK